MTAIGIHSNLCLLKPIHGYPDLYQFECCLTRLPAVLSSEFQGLLQKVRKLQSNHTVGEEWHFFSHASALLSTVSGMVLTVGLSFVTLWSNFKKTPTIMCFSPNGSPKTLVFSDVKTVQKFEEYHPKRNNILHIPTFWQPASHADPKPSYDNPRWNTICRLQLPIFR